MDISVPCEFANTIVCLISTKSFSVLAYLFNIDFILLTDFRRILRLGVFLLILLSASRDRLVACRNNTTFPFQQGLFMGRCRGAAADLHKISRKSLQRDLTIAAVSRELSEAV